VKGNPDLSWHIINDLVAHEFDVVTCQEMSVDHAVMLPLKLMYPDAGGQWPVTLVPVAINSIQHPLPSAARCWKLGVEIGKAIRSFDKDLKVLVCGTGGLSHQLDGTRAGFINKKFDELCMDKIVHDPEALTEYSNRQIIELAGSQGVELMTWIAMRGAMGGDARVVTQTNHIPISNTAGAVMLLEPMAEAARIAAE
jgi:protocatechuate 4,5-dioxygenase beta chain